MSEMAQLQPLSLELLDTYTCLVANFPLHLHPSALLTYELVPSPYHRGFLARLKMLNSLKRYLEELGIRLPDLPNEAFKMFKSVHAGANDKKRNSAASILMRSFRNQPLNLQSSSPHPLKDRLGLTSGMPEVCHLGRWVLTNSQKASVLYFLSRNRRMILADDSNLGKTVTALACMNYSRCKKVLILAPRLLVCNWTWHVQQLKGSLGVRKKVKVEDCHNAGDRKIILNVLDYCDNHQKSTIALNVKCQKQQQAKPEVKKEQQSSEKPTAFAICSYEHLRSNFEGQQLKAVLEEHDAIIIDAPPAWLAGHKQLVKQLAKIEAIIISKYLSLGESAQFLPILNPKVSHKQLSHRYGQFGGAGMNANEYELALKRCYYSRSCRQKVKPPGGIIKNVMIESSDHDWTLKCKQASKYVEWLTQQTQFAVYLVYEVEKQREQIVRLLHECRIQYSQAMDQQAGERVRLGTLAQITSHVTTSVPTLRCRVVIATTFPYRQHKQAENYLCQLCRCAQIQYIQLVGFNKTTLSVERTQLSNQSIWLPRISEIGYVKKMQEAGLEISSDGEDLHATKRHINPQRYIDSEEQNQIEPKPTEAPQQVPRPSEQVVAVSPVKLVNIEIEDSLGSSCRQCHNVAQICIESDEQQPKTNKTRQLADDEQPMPTIPQLKDDHSLIRESANRQIEVIEAVVSNSQNKSEKKKSKRVRKYERELAKIMRPSAIALKVKQIQTSNELNEPLPAQSVQTRRGKKKSSPTTTQHSPNKLEQPIPVKQEKPGESSPVVCNPRIQGLFTTVPHKLMDQGISRFGKSRTPVEKPPGWVPQVVELCSDDENQATDMVVPHPAMEQPAETLEVVLIPKVSSILGR